MCKENKKISQDTKLEAISKKVGGSEDTWKSKILRKKGSSAHRAINKEDYRQYRIIAKGGKM